MTSTETDVSLSEMDIPSTNGTSIASVLACRNHIVHIFIPDLRMKAIRKTLRSVNDLKQIV